MKKLLVYLVFCLFIITAGESCRTTVATQPSAVITARPAAPGADYVWVGGEWRPRHRTYVYNQGYWVAPSGRHRTYVEGHWVHTRHGWYWQRGHWQ